MYTVYKIHNKLNQKTYVGVHKTDNPNDSYMGSGKAIISAIKKYGKENFEKLIIFVTEDKKEAYDLEQKLTVDFDNYNSYNMRLGGVGGFTSENAKKGYVAANFSREMLSENGKKIVKTFSKEQLSENGRKGGLKNKGRKKGPLSEKTKQKIRESLLKRNMSL